MVGIKGGSVFGPAIVGYAGNETRGAQKTDLPAAVPTTGVRPTGGLTYVCYPYR